MTVAFIPVRGGSKSIPLKNIKEICGKPLVYWTVKAACSCKYIDKVYVATDSTAIKETVESFKSGNEAGLFEKLNVIDRSAESATDTASTEFAMLEFAEKHDFNDIVLIQATSPLLSNVDLNNGFELYKEADTDSVLSAVRQKRFNWDVDENGFANPTNYDVFKRPRRQEFKGYLVENGAFYITSKNLLMESKNRVSGNIRIAEMDEDTFFEIDEPSDWLIIEALMKKKGLGKTPNLNKIKMFLTDCDGCLTDGGMYYSEDGDELKKFNTRDGMAFALLQGKGILTGLITGENVELNKRRVEKTHMNVYIPGCKDKLGAVSKLCKEKSISLNEVLYIGDDINDLPLLEKVGFSCCPKDAIDIVKKTVDYVSSKNGGEGVIREIADLLIENR